MYEWRLATYIFVYTVHPQKCWLKLRDYKSISHINLGKTHNYESPAEPSGRTGDQLIEPAPRTSRRSTNTKLFQGEAV